MLSWEIWKIGLKLRKSMAGLLKDKAVSLLTLIVTTVVVVSITGVTTFYLTRYLENAGEPKLTGRINAIVIRKPVDRMEWEGTVYLNVTNLEEKDTFIKINQFDIVVPGVDPRTAQIKVDRHFYVDKFRSKNDTISFRLPPRLWVKSDTVSTRFDSIAVSCDLYYPSGKVAQKLKFNLEPKDLQMYFTWWPLPKDIYFALHEASVKNKLPKEWKREELNFRGQRYDCYYTPPDVKLKIGFSGETMRVSQREDNNDFQNVKLGGLTMIKFWNFVAHPRIEDRFVDFKKRGVRIVYEEREKGRVISGEFDVWFEQGYSYAYFLKQ